MRLLLVGAFPYPHHQGSQVYFKEQAIALRSAGMEISLLTYASNTSDASKNRSAEMKAAGRDDAEHWRALDGFECRTSPGWTSPISMRSGPSWAKPLGDLGLAMTLRNAVASNRSHDAYDAILTHNAEAALIALHALPRSRPPILYCLHTLLGNELSSYRRGKPEKGGLSESPSPFGVANPPIGLLDRLGDGIDRWIAKRVDGWLCLTQSSECVMRQFSRAPGALVAPPLADPELAPEPLDPVRVARRHSLEAGHYFLYAGNIDGYQELDILAAAAVELAGRSASPPPIIVASHSPRPSTLRDAWRQPGRADPLAERLDGWVESIPGIQRINVESAAEMIALLSAARASLVTRRTKGGFPIKIVNSLAVGTPVIAFREQEWGLTHGRNSLICAPERPVLALADAIEQLAGDDVLAARLGAAARVLYRERHRPEHVALKTLALIRKVASLRPR